MIYTWRSLFVLTMQNIQTKRALSDDPDAVRKRANREYLREKRRQESFVKSYIETKYPNVHAEAIGVYNTFKERYPDKHDITKTYYYRKWVKETKKIIASTYVVPVFPTSTVHPSLPATSTSSVPPVLPPFASPAVSSPATASSTETVSPTSAKNQYTLYVPHLPILTSINGISDKEVAVETIQEGEQTRRSPENVQQILNETQESLEQTEQFLAELAQNEENQTKQSREEVVQPQQTEEIAQDQSREETQSNDIFSGMSLNEMDIAAEEIVRALQSDRELMDIVENFDFPDGVWNNDLAVPDYVLESDMEW